MSATASWTDDLRLIASTSASRWPAVSSLSCSTSAWKSLASTMVLPRKSPAGNIALLHVRTEPAEFIEHAQFLGREQDLEPFKALAGHWVADRTKLQWLRTIR